MAHIGWGGEQIIIYKGVVYKGVVYKGVETFP